MIPVEQALARIRGAVRPTPPEQVALPQALGRVLAEDVAARRTQPPAAVSSMDGYAVRAVDVAKLPVTLKVIGTAPAGGMFEGIVGAGETVRIFTGGPVPGGADAVVMQENTRAGDGAVEIVEGETPVGRFIRPAGLDFSEGDVLLPAGRVLTARDVGLAAAMNFPWLRVRRKPRIALLSTGDEVVMPGDPIRPLQIVSSNALALSAFIEACGGAATDLGIAPDREDALRAMAAGAQGADMLVTTGGASVGDHDLVSKVLGQIGLEVDFWKIAMRPGKPLIFGHMKDSLLLGLPGNPVSALVCATVFLGPAIRAMLAIDDDKLPRHSARLGVALGPNDERQDYLRAAISHGDDGSRIATPLGKQDSSVFSGLALADCLIVRPPFAEAAACGDPVTIIPLGGGIIST